ncbi:hypothetical protein ACFY1A_20930 [Streptomyces sp. NPDC001520]|uniref:hypothetical protein n=1 Tax=Streptomyces sp. NPDC001520 TaxID=3364581 RepID=UPI0036CDF95E
MLALWMLRKKFAKAVKKKFYKGVWSGTLLTIGTGLFAYIGSAVIPSTNSLGGWALNGLVHGTIGALA